MRLLKSVLGAVLFMVAPVVQAQQVTATVAYSDTAQSKIQKTPIGTYLETLAKATSKHTIVLNATVDPATLTGDTQFSYRIDEQSSSSDDYTVTFKLSDDPKYTPGATSAKFNFSTIGGVSPTGLVLVSASVKISKSTVVITITDKVRPVYAQQFLNFSFKPKNNPEGKGTGTKASVATISFGTLAAMQTVPYTAAYTNKGKAINGTTYFAGSSKGTAKSQ